VAAHARGHARAGARAAVRARGRGAANRQTGTVRSTLFLSGCVEEGFVPLPLDDSVYELLGEHVRERKAPLTARQNDPYTSPQVEIANPSRVCGARVVFPTFLAACRFRPDAMRGLHCRWAPCAAEAFSFGRKTELAVHPRTQALVKYTVEGVEADARSGWARHRVSRAADVHACPERDAEWPFVDHAWPAAYQAGPLAWDLRYAMPAGSREPRAVFGGRGGGLGVAPFVAHPSEARVGQRFGSARVPRGGLARGLLVALDLALGGPLAAPGEQGAHRLLQLERARTLARGDLGHVRSAVRCGRAAPLRGVG